MFYLDLLGLKNVIISPAQSKEKQDIVGLQLL